MKVDQLSDPSPAPEADYHQFIDPSKKWYKNRRLVVLNLWIFLLYSILLGSSVASLANEGFTYRLITSTANGYDGSMMSQ